MLGLTGLHPQAGLSAAPTLGAEGLFCPSWQSKEGSRGSWIPSAPHHMSPEPLSKANEAPPLWNFLSDLVEM